MNQLVVVEMLNRYRRPLRAGDLAVVMSGLASFSDKVLTFAHFLYLNGRLAKFYGAELPADAPFTSSTRRRRRRSRRRRRRSRHRRRRRHRHPQHRAGRLRSEEHTSELQSQCGIAYAVLCL